MSREPGDSWALPESQQGQGDSVQSLTAPLKLNLCKLSFVSSGALQALKVTQVKLLFWQHQSLETSFCSSFWGSALRLCPVLTPVLQVSSLLSVTQTGKPELITSMYPHCKEKNILAGRE